MKTSLLIYCYEWKIIEQVRDFNYPGCNFKILTGKPTGKTPLGRPRRRWEDNIKMDLEEIGISMRVIGLIELRIGIIGEPLWMRH